MAIGNPWGAAAQSYGQDLDQLTKIQMGGMQQAAQMPLQLYDRFMDGYEKARQRAQQERQFEMQQAQLDRQNRLADLQFQKDSENEAYRRRQENLKMVLDANKDITATGKEIGLDYTPDMRERFKAQLVDPLMQKGLPKLDAQLRAEKLLPALKATPIPNVQINEGQEAVPLLPSDYRVGRGFTGEDTFMGQRPAQLEQTRIRDENRDAATIGAQNLAAKREERLAAENARRLDQGDRRIDMLGQKLAAGDKYKLGPEEKVDLAHRMIQGLEPWPTGRVATDPDYKEALAIARKLDPTFNADTSKVRLKTQQAFTTGKQGDAVNAFNTAVSHLDRWEKNVAKINNPGVAAIGKFKVASLRQINDPDVLAADSDTNTLATELERAYRLAGGTEEGIRKFRENLGAHLSPAGAKAMRKEIAGLLGGKLEQNEMQYQQGMGGFGKLEMISPETRKILEDSGYVIKNGKPTPAPSPSPQGKTITITDPKTKKSTTVEDTQERREWAKKKGFSVS